MAMERVASGREGAEQVGHAQLWVALLTRMMEEVSLMQGKGCGLSYASSLVLYLEYCIVIQEVSLRQGKGCSIHLHWYCVSSTVS